MYFSVLENDEICRWYDVPSSKFLNHQIVLPPIIDERICSLMDCDNPQPTSAGEKTKQLQESWELICKVIMDGDLELSGECDKLNDDDFFYVPAPFKEMTPELEESIKLRLSLDHPHIIKTHDYLIRDTPDEYGWREVVYTEEQMNCVLSRYVWLIKKITYAEKKELVLKVTEGLNYLREQDVFIHELDVCFIYLYNQL